LPLGQLSEDTGFAPLAQPVALASDIDGRREVQQPVEDRCSQNLIGEDV
jgi:hypothetical protein